MSPLAQFFLAVVTAAIPLALLSNVLRINPHRPLVFLALVPALLSIGMFGTPAMLVPVLILDAVLVLIAVADLFTLPRKKAFACERHAGRIASLRKLHPVTLTVTNFRNRPFLVWVRDGVPAELGPDREEFQFALAPRTRATLSYQLQVHRRGAYTISQVYLRVRSRLGLWMRYLKYDVETVIHVYPDMQQLSQYALLARANRLNLVGVRRLRRIGQDNEFERLRDYTLGDNYKNIDWRSTARRQKLTVKDFQQTNSGELLVELTGTLLNQFDRIAATGVAQVDGYLNIDIDEISPGVPFVPVLGQTFNIITGNTVAGTFDYADVSGMPAGLAFHINYLVNAVQLQVVNKPIFSADFDDDGDVDLTDYHIWRGAFKLNQLGDADGDNDSDGADYVMWRDQSGSHPGAGAGAGFDGASVPEPAGALLLVMGVVALMGRRRPVGRVVQ